MHHKDSSIFESALRKVLKDVRGQMNLNLDFVDFLSGHTSSYPYSKTKIKNGGHRIRLSAICSQSNASREEKTRAASET